MKMPDKVEKLKRSPPLLEALAGGIFCFGQISIVQNCDFRLRDGVFVVALTYLPLALFLQIKSMSAQLKT